MVFKESYPLNYLHNEEKSQEVTSLDNFADRLKKLHINIKEYLEMFEDEELPDYLIFEAKILLRYYEEYLKDNENLSAEYKDLLDDLNEYKIHILN